MVAPGDAGDVPPAAVDLADFELLAKAKMDRVDFDYYASGAEDEVTLGRNRSAWGRMTIWPRVLVDVSNVQLGRRFLGMDLPGPFVVPPMAMQKLAHPDGEIALARAAHAGGCIYCIAQQSTTTMEQICAGAPGPKLFQMYVFRNREMSERLIRRAEACGVKAIVITVDSAVLGRRERDLRNRFTPKSRGVEIVNWANSTSTGGGTSAASVVSARTGDRDSSFSWADLAWLKSVTNLPLILKGLVHPADAELAVQHGMAAVWVSNHGGRQLDGGPGTAAALPLLARAVAGRVPIIVDGGIRRGADALKALALGADLVGVGRPLLWALAVDGERGATTALGMLREELRTAMALSGVPSVAAARPTLVEASSLGAPPPLGRL